MRYNRLGSTGLFVSSLGLGTMTFGARDAFAHMGEVDQDQADAIVARALAAGVNLIDTADVYSGGDSERITGRALRNLGVRREEVIVATKVFGEMGSGPNQRGLSRGNIMDGVRASLERLQMDHIDLYQLHGFDPATPVEETLRALDDLVRQGMVRYVGVSNWAAWQISRALGIADRLQLTRFASLQAYYSLAGRDAERELVPMLAAEGLGMLVWSPPAGGLLSDKHAAGGDAQGSRRSVAAFPPVDESRAGAVLERLRVMAAEKDTSVAQLALAWLLHQPGVTSVLVGAKRLEQLEDNLRALDVRFTPEELQLVGAASALPPEYPGWMIDLWSGARAEQLAAAAIPGPAVEGGGTPSQGVLA